MKPFNLERALAGDPVQTMDGRPVTQLTRFECKCRNVVGVVEGALHLWDEEGNCGGIYDPNKVTLVMVPVKKYGWVNLYKNSRGEIVTLSEPIFKAHHLAVAAVNNMTDFQKAFGKYIETVKVEWEE